MLERWLRFQHTFVATLLTLGVLVAMVWGGFGLAPHRIAFWAVVGPFAVLFIGVDAIQRVRAWRGVDVKAERDTLVRGTAERYRERYRLADSGGRLRRPLRLMTISGVAFVAGLGLAQVWTPFAALAILGLLGLLGGELAFLVRLVRKPKAGG